MRSVDFVHCQVVDFAGFEAIREDFEMRSLQLWRKAGKCIVIGDNQGGYETPAVADHNHIFEIWNQFQPIFNGLGSDILSAGRDDDDPFSDR